MNDTAPELSISVVSHQQADLVSALLGDFSRYCTGVSLEVIVTVNVDEPVAIDPAAFLFPVTLIRNDAPKGFGENHNAAFRLARGRFFCVMNPDIRLTADPFRTLLAQCAMPSTGVVAPRIVNEAGVLEDSARALPTPSEIFRKLLGGASTVQRGRQGLVSEPDWLAGMFLLFSPDAFSQVGGFDERYFLYYEDVDICVRLRLAGYRLYLCHTVSAIHQARRSSHRSMRYLRWHLSSMLRFFLSDGYRRIRRSGQG